jgi:ubiquinone/menaquinone biosynthesis C-methylase UbiE
MSDRRVDYNEIAKVYDAARTPDRPHVEWWLARMAEAGGLGPGKRLLDLGCGTGRWTILLTERAGCEAVGVDSSQEMLKKARAKDKQGRVTWLLGDACSPPVSPESFDCVLMSYALHHFDDPPAALRAAFIALRPGGMLLIRQPTLDQVIDDPGHRFFPEAVTIDRKRIPFGVEIEAWLAMAGFESITAESVRMRTQNSPQGWLLEAEHRVCSTFRLMSDEAFAHGLAELRGYIQVHPDDPWLVEDSMTLFSARRPEC